MKVGDLKKALNNYDDDLTVFVSVQKPDPRKCPCVEICINSEDKFRDPINNTEKGIQRTKKQEVVIHGW